MAYKNWTIEEENLLRNLLLEKKYSFNQMAKFFQGRSGLSLSRHAKDYLNLKNEGFIFKKYSYNQDFFAIPDIINCYVAGFYAADGCISDNPTTRVLSIVLSGLELDQLKKFKELFQFTGPIDSYEYEYKKNMHGLRIYSAYKITEDLEKNFNLGPNKVYRLPPPNLTDSKLKFAYLIGLLDGDGCVHINNQNKLTITYSSSSLQIMEWVKNEIENMNLRSIKNKGGIIRKFNHANAYGYQVSGLKAVDLIFKAQELKKEGVPILDRKWDNEKLNNYIKEFKEKHKIS